MHKLQPVRGTRDLLDHELMRHRTISKIAHQIAATYGFTPIATPIFEYTSVFTKPLGETSDIVGKEMYTFQDRGGESITLRPEGTASVVRAIMNEGLTQTLPQRRILEGPMFRYERPQKGRYRQLHQISIEHIGTPGYTADVDVIAMAHDLLSAIGLKTCVLHLNTLGDHDSRRAYRTALVDYFSQHIDRLSADSQQRLDKNPLRILDSKDPNDQEIARHAPKLSASLNEPSRTFFNQICTTLTALNIPYIHDETLVRGLDYYCHTVFEFKTPDLGAQDTVLGGGRYDGLMEQMGGPSVPAVGWACGLDRLALLADNLNIDDPMLHACILPLSDVEETHAFILAHTLRQQGITVDVLTGGNLGKRFKQADKRRARYAIIIGEDEIASQTYTVKNLIPDQDAAYKEQKMNLHDVITLLLNVI